MPSTTILTFIKKYKNLIKEDNFEKLYQNLIYDLGSSHISELSQTLLNASINPLKYFTDGYTHKEFLCNATIIYNIEELITKNIRFIDAYAFAFMKGIKPTLDLSGTNVETISGHAFAGNSITNIHLPKSILRIGPNAFSTCTELRTIIFDGRPSDIRMLAFKNCSELQLVDLSCVTYDKFMTECTTSSQAFAGVSDDCEFKFSDKTVKLKDLWEN